MDPVSAGASVLAFVALALQGTKALYQTISGLKNTSQHTTALASAVGNLQTILTQLENCRALAEPNSDLQHVKDLLNACNNDVRRYEKELKKIQPSPNASRAQNTFKKLKAFLTEKDLQVMWKEVNHHCTVLGVQLNLVQCNITLGCRDKIHEIHNTFSTRASDMSILNGTVENVKVSIADHIQDAVMSISRNIEQVSKISGTQIENVATLLRALQDQIAGFPAQLTVTQSRLPTSRGIVIDPSDDSSVSGKSPDLKDCIKRLCQLVTQSGGTAYSEEAQVIIDDLGYLLETISELDDNAGSRTSQKRRADTFCRDESISSREMKRLCSLVTIAHSIDVNRGTRRPLLSTNGKITQKRKSKEITIPGGKVSITITEKQTQALSRTGNKATVQSGPTEIFARVKALLEHEQSPTVLVAHIHKVQLLRGFSSPSPIIRIGRSLPNESPIFDLVSDGKLEQVQRLLARGEYTLWDRSSLGAPLLHYAMKQPHMCKFLIDHGADVDEIADFDCTGIRFRITPLEVYDNYWPRDHDEHHLILECKRLVLEAGGDPTVSAYEYFNPFSKEACLGGSTEVLRMMLDIAGPFIDLEMKDDHNRTPLLEHSVNWNKRYDLLRLGLLLARGANIHAQDMYGNTCLHNWVKEARDIDGKDFESLVLLIRSGADIYSVNNVGESISVTAYTLNYSDQMWRIGGYRGDLWDAVLSECGHDIRQMRKGYHRIPRYAQKYTRSHFARLWAGREEFCPYFHDPPMWCADSLSSAGDCPKGGLGSCCEEEVHDDETEWESAGEDPVEEELSEDEVCSEAE